METNSVRQLVECWKWSLQFVHAGVVSWGVTICPGVGSCGATIYPGAGSCGVTICPGVGSGKAQFVSGYPCRHATLHFSSSSSSVGCIQVDQKHRIPELGPWRPIFTEQAWCIFEFSSNIFFTHILHIYDIFFRCRIFFVFYFSVSSFLFPFSLLSIWCKCKNSCCIYSTVLIFSNIGLFKMSLTFSLKGQYSVKLIWGNAMDTRISNLQ